MEKCISTKGVCTEMMLLCVDGIDPDKINEFGWNKVFKYNYKLEIPRECFIPDPELGSTPHTTRVWPSIFSGQIIDYGLIRRKGARKVIHDFLVRSRITWSGKKNYKIKPYNENLDTVLDHYHSFAWNIPTISPEWILSFPSYESFVKYCKREFMMWGLICFGSRFGSFDLEAYYMRYLDYVGHNEPDNLKRVYDQILMMVKLWKEKREDIILLSDHGTVDGVHTNYAYLGSDRKFKAGSINEIRGDLERLLRNAGARKQ